MTPVEIALRRLLLALFALGVAGVAAELLLLGHYEGYRQPIPLFLLAVALASLVAYGLRPSARRLRYLRGASVLCIVAGFAGVVFHYQGNVEFELELTPSLGGFGLLWEAMRGATPLLAPGAMIQLGCLGFGFCLRHPALREPAGIVPGSIGGANVQAAASSDESDRARVVGDERSVGRGPGWRP